MVVVPEREKDKDKVDALLDIIKGSKGKQHLGIFLKIVGNALK